jgi:hypothetical protein
VAGGQAQRAQRDHAAQRRKRRSAALHLGQAQLLQEGGAGGSLSWLSWAARLRGSLSAKP